LDESEVLRYYQSLLGVLQMKGYGIDDFDSVVGGIFGFG